MASIVESSSGAQGVSVSEAQAMAGKENIPEHESAKRKLGTSGPKDEPQGKKATKTSPPKEVIGMPEAERKKQIKKLTADCIKAIKKTGHTQKNKPWTEWRVGMDRATALALLGSHGKIISDTNKNHKRFFSPKDIFEWLPNMPTIIKDVKFTGKMFFFSEKGCKVSVEFECLEVKHDGSTLILKFRTFLYVPDPHEVLYGALSDSD